MIESLIKAGAMDSLDGTRAQLFATIDGAMEAGQRVAARPRERPGRPVRRPARRARAPPSSRCPTSPTGPPSEKLTGEKEMLGFYVTGHPLDEYDEKVSELATHTHQRTLEGLERGTEVALCGILTGIQRRRNKEGKPWAVDAARGPVRAARSAWSSPRSTSACTPIWSKTTPC